MGYLYRLFGNTSSNVTSNGTNLLIITNDDNNDFVRLVKTNAALLKFEIRVVTFETIQKDMEHLQWAEAIVMSLPNEQVTTLKFPCKMSWKVISNFSEDIPDAFLKSAYKQGAICMPTLKHEPTEVDIKHLLEKMYGIVSVLKN